MVEEVVPRAVIALANQIPTVLVSLTSMVRWVMERSSNNWASKSSGTAVVRPLMPIWHRIAGGHSSVGIFRAKEGLLVSIEGPLPGSGSSSTLVALVVGLPGVTPLIRTQYGGKEV